jgi:hypothetical protein
VTTVWVLIHDDLGYDSGGVWVRDVYATEESATAAIEAADEPTPGPARIDHDAVCCSVQAFDVLDEAMA